MNIRLFLLSFALLLTLGAVGAPVMPDSTRDCDCEHCRRHAYTSEELYEIRLAIPRDSLIEAYYTRFPVRVFDPKIFTGFRPLRPVSFAVQPIPFEMDARKNAYDRDRYAGILYAEEIDPSELEEGDEVLTFKDLVAGDSITARQLIADSPREELNPRDFKLIPDWLAISNRAERIHADMNYRLMTDNPRLIQYAYWELPEPPRLPEEDNSFAGFLRRLDLPNVDTSSAILPDFQRRHINWLHSVGGALQLSQAYISSNWYQGGNNYLAVLFNFNWNVTLNTVYHPNLMFVSDLSYKLAVNSNPSGSLHRYSISQDLFQYNLRTGVKAFKKWFYSFNLLFKTQFFTSYPADSDKPGAKILSPSELNLGLGMTYNTTGCKGRLKFAASISPISYNLKACPSTDVDHAQFNIPPDRRTASEIGSNAELTLNWDITSNISWKSRLFLFTNYDYFQGNWENTFNFAINKFLSTQLYVHPRFDSSSDRNSSKWHYWQLKEILSFGLSYTFTTKP